MHLIVTHTLNGMKEMRGTIHQEEAGIDIHRPGTAFLTTSIPAA